MCVGRWARLGEGGWIGAIMLWEAALIANYTQKEEVPGTQIWFFIIFFFKQKGLAVMWIEEFLSVFLLV